MVDGECTIWANSSGIKGTIFTLLTSIVGDGMKGGGWILPGNNSARPNVYNFRGIIRCERFNGNPQCGGSCCRKRTYQHYSRHQSDGPGYFHRRIGKRVFQKIPFFINSILFHGHNRFFLPWVPFFSITNIRCKTLFDPINYYIPPESFPSSFSIDREVEGYGTLSTDFTLFGG